MLPHAPHTHIPAHLLRIRTKVQYGLYLAGFLVLLFFAVEFFIPLHDSHITFIPGQKQSLVTSFEPRERFVLKNSPNSQESAVMSVIDDPLYFKTALLPKHQPGAYEKIRVRVHIRHTSHPDLRLGLRTGELFSFYMQPLSMRGLNEVSYPSIHEKNITLYQKEQTFSSVTDFLAHIPQDKKIGTYFYDFPHASSQEFSPPSYQPSVAKQHINSTFRGSHTFTTYIKNEPLVFEAHTRSLGWTNTAPSPVRVLVTNAASRQIVSDTTVIAGSPISLSMPGLASGVYRISIQAGTRTSDTLLSDITTSQRYFVAESPLVLASSELYGVATAPTTLFTHANQISTRVLHPQSAQQLSINDASLIAASVARPHTTIASDEIRQIRVPQNDLVLESHAPFAFSEQAWFSPQGEHIVNLNNQPFVDLGTFDYIVTTYQQPTVDGQDVIAEATFDAKLAYREPRTDTIEFLLSAPRIAEAGNSIDISRIDIDLIHKPFTLDRIKTAVKKIFSKK